MEFLPARIEEQILFLEKHSTASVGQKRYTNGYRVQNKPAPKIMLYSVLQHHPKEYSFVRADIIRW